MDRLIFIYAYIKMSSFDNEKSPPRGSPSNHEEEKSYSPPRGTPTQRRPRRRTSRVYPIPYLQDIGFIPKDGNEEDDIQTEVYTYGAGRELIRLLPSIIGQENRRVGIIPPEIGGVIESYMPADFELLNEAFLDACHRGDLEQVKYLDEQEPQLEFDRIKALRRAAKKGHLDVVKYLVEHSKTKIDITADRNLAVRWAAKYGHLNIVKYLVKHGADVTAVNNEAIKAALHFGYVNMIDYFRKQGYIV